MLLEVILSYIKCQHYTVSIRSKYEKKKYFINRATVVTKHECCSRVVIHLLGNNYKYQ